MKELSDKFVTNCFWLALVLLCGVCTAFCTSISQLREDKQWVTHTHQVIETLNDVDAKLSNTESARRGSIIATKTSYLLAYKQEKPKIYAKLKTVRYLTKDNFFQQHRLNTLEPLVERRFDLFDKSINSLKTDKVDKVTQVSVTDQGKQLHEQIRYIIDAMVKEEHTLLERRTLQTNSRVRNIVFIGASGSCLSLLLFLTVYKLLQKQIRINGVLSQEAILLEQKAAKTKLVAFLESTTDAFVALDNDWQYIYVNSRAGQIFNRRPEDLIGRNIWEEFPEGIGQKFYQAYHQAMEQQQMIQLEEYFPPWDCWFENRIYPSQEGLSIFFQDITERVIAVQELKTINEELEVKVQQRTQELQLLNNELQRSNQELEEFVYIASHDLQEPLRAITCFAQLLQQDLQQLPHLTNQEYMYYILDATQRMQQLIKDLLAYSRIAAGNTKFVPTDCNAVLCQVLKNLQVAISESGATISYKDLPTLMADKTQLIQLFQNLISNAIKFRAQETLNIHIGVFRGQNKQLSFPPSFSHFTLPSLSHNQYLFWVQDNGIGIKSKYLERIFEAFRRLHTREEFPGTGIGLAICKKVVELHGGYIWADSRVGVGTFFYFTLKGDCVVD